MIISTLEELKAWDFVWPKSAPGPWLLDKGGITTAFAGRPFTTGVYWIGFTPTGGHALFRAVYCGKAVRQSLPERLMQHARGSSNRHILEHLGTHKTPPLYFRFVEIPDPSLVNVLEGLEIAAFRDEYLWNGRNEWKQHWASEEL